MFGNSLSSQSLSLRPKNDWGMKGREKPLPFHTFPTPPHPPLPTHNLLETGSCVFSPRVTCPWKINRYLFRKLSKAFRNLTLVERERMCC